MLPITLAPAPSSTPRPIFGWRSPRSALVPPRVTPCSIETSSPTTAVSPMTMPVPWSKKTPLPIARRRMDVDLEQLRHAALQVEGQRLAALAPQPVRHAVGLQGQEALEEQERLHVALAGRVALEHRLQVGLGRGDRCRGRRRRPPRRSRAGSWRAAPGRRACGPAGRTARAARSPWRRITAFSSEARLGSTGRHVLGLVAQRRPDRRRRGGVDDFQALHHRRRPSLVARSCAARPAH